MSVAALVGAAGVALLLAALVDSHLRLSGFGLVSSLPPSFEIGLALVPISGVALWARPRAPALVLILPVVAFALVLWLMPVVLEGTARFRSSYANFGFVDPLLRGVPLDPARFIYDDWPAFPLSIAALVSLLHVQVEALMAVFPAVMILAYLAPLAGLLIVGTSTAQSDDPPVTTTSAATPRYTWVAGLWFFLVLDWTGQDYFSPQAVAYFLYLVWLLLVGHVTLRRNGRFGSAETAAMLALFLALVMTHVLTSLIALVELGALWVARLHRRPSLVLTCAAIFVAWQAFPAASFYAQHSQELAGALTSITDFVSRNLANRVAGSPGHELVALLRIGVTVLGFGFALVGAMVVRGVEGSFGRPERFAAALLAGVAIVTPLSVYGGEMLIRALLFSLPALALLVARSAHLRAVRGGLVVVLAVMAIAEPVTLYGNEQYDYVSPAELQGFEVVSGLAPANIYGGYPAAAFQNTALLSWRNPFEAAAKGGLSPDGFLAPQLQGWQHPDLPIYVVLSRGDEAAATLFFDQPGFVASIERRLDADQNFRRVFANQDVVIYRWLGAPPAPTGSVVPPRGAPS